MGYLRSLSEWSAQRMMVANVRLLRAQVKLTVLKKGSTARERERFRNMGSSSSNSTLGEWINDDHENLLNFTKINVDLH